MKTTAEHCIAAIGLNAYRHERNIHDLIILSLPVRLCVSVERQLLCQTYCRIAPHSGWLYFACLLHLQLQHYWLRLPESNETSYIGM